MPELDALFERGWDLNATDLFVNRVDAVESFQMSLDYHIRALADREASLARPDRRNVLVFYGAGGSGKTELSRRLQEWVSSRRIPLDWPDPPTLDFDIATIRVDLHGSDSMDVGDVLLKLRSAAAGPARPFPAFDAGFSVWWTLSRPGAPLPKAQSRRGGDVTDEMMKTINGVLAEAGSRMGVGPFSLKTGALIVDAVTRRASMSATLARTPQLGYLIEECRIDPGPMVAASLAGLLSLDFERLPIPSTPVVVAFVDAAERLQTSELGEALLNRLIYLTPWVLWVITTRQRLDWPETDGRAIPRRGPAVWPTLSPGYLDEPRQHLVGYLDNSDVARFLSRASNRRDIPDLPEAIQRKIGSASYGLPLYLDLAVGRAREIGRDRELAVEDFGEPFPQLVARILSDLPPEEQLLAHYASLVPQFSEDMLTRATDLGQAVVRRFLDRPIVQRDSSSILSHRVHELVAESIAASVKEYGAERWTPEDRREAGAKLLDALAEMCLDARGSDNLEARLTLVETSFALASRLNLEPSWLLDEMNLLPTQPVLAGMGLPGADMSQWTGQLRDYFEARARRSTSARAEALAVVASRSDLADDIRAHVMRFLGYSLENSDRPGEALPIFRQLGEQYPKSSIYPRHIGIALRLMGQYRRARVHMDEAGLAKKDRDALEAMIAFDHGLLEESTRLTSTRVLHFEAAGHARVAMEMRGTFLFRSTLASQPVTGDEVEGFLDLSSRVVHDAAFRSALMAKGILCAGQEELFNDVRHDQLAFLHVTGAQEGFREWIPEILHELRLEDDGRLSRLHESWADAERKWAPGAALVDRLFEFAGYPRSLDWSNVDYLDPPEVVTQRWNLAFSRLTRQRRL